MVPSTEGYLDTYDREHEYWKLFGTNYRGIAHTEFEDNWYPIVPFKPVAP